MKRTRRIAFLLVTVLVMSLMSISAFAKSKYQVPAAGDFYHLNTETNEWVKDGSFVATYKSDGSITSYTWTEYQDPKNTWVTVPADTNKITYTWKKGFVTKRTSTSTSNFQGWGTTPNYQIVYTGTTKYKYKGSLPKQQNYTYSNVTTNPETAYRNHSSSSVTKYSWKGKVGTAKNVNKTTGSKTSYLIEATKKNQYKGYYNENSKIEYAKNGNIKKETTKYSGSQYKGTATTKYNKYGYVSSFTSTQTYSMPYKVGTVSRSTAISYVMGSGKCPSEIVYTTTSSGDTYDPKYPPTSPRTPDVNQYKVVVTATKAVKSVKNCDKYGHRVVLGINLEDEISDYVGPNEDYTYYYDDDM